MQAAKSLLKGYSGPKMKLLRYALGQGGAKHTAIGCALQAIQMALV